MRVNGSFAGQTGRFLKLVQWPLLICAIFGEIQSFGKLGYSETKHNVRTSWQIKANSRAVGSILTASALTSIDSPRDLCRVAQSEARCEYCLSARYIYHFSLLYSFDQVVDRRSGKAGLILFD